MIALDTLGGIAIVAGIAMALFVLGLVLHALFHRFGQTRPHVQERRPRRGSVSKSEGP